LPFLIRVDAHSGVPVFRQIVDQIRFHIVSAMVEAGDELPSTRTLSAELRVNPMTVSKAFVLLEQEGLIERRPGLPVVVRALGDDAAERERSELLREALDPAVVIARQLGISITKATAMFREMLADAAREEEEQR
jgi:GntR family transcriptional regulator